MTKQTVRSFRKAAAVLCILCTAMAHAADPFARASLQGITAIRVIIEEFSAEASSLGLDRAALKTAAELRLRRSGVKVSDATSPYLYINVNLVPVLGGDFVAYNVSVEFNQKAKLLVNQKTQFVTTWNTSNTGGVGKQNVYQIRRFLDDMVDAFVNDYLAANQE